MRSRRLALVAAALVAAIIAGSFLYYLALRRTETALGEPYATLVISRLDNFMPPTMDVPFHPVDAIMSPGQGCGGCLIVRDAVLDANYIYSQKSARCAKEGTLDGGYCDGTPVYAVYMRNLTEAQYRQVYSAEPLKFLNSTRDWTSVLYYKDPQCFPFAHNFAAHPKKDGFCYYGLRLVRNWYTEERG